MFREKLIILFLSLFSGLALLLGPAGLLSAWADSPEAAKGQDAKAGKLKTPARAEAVPSSSFKKDFASFNKLNPRKGFFEGEFKHEVIDVSGEEEDADRDSQSSEKGLIKDLSQTKDKDAAQTKEIKAADEFSAGNPQGSADLAQEVSKVVGNEKSETAYRPVFDTDDPSKKVQPPDEMPQVAINRDAPGPAIGLVTAFQQKDMELAKKYANQWVLYQQEYIFTVREITELIGKALIEQGEIQEDDWDGVGQFINQEMARTRTETGQMLKPRHEVAMKRIVPDPNNEVEVYYFFTLNCSWCRKMAPDVERLWQVAQNDSKIKMVALTIGETPKSWIEEYRDYTGLSVPIFQGDNVAKNFNVKYTPAVVIVTPGNNKAYLKTGQQSFSRLYDFLRHAQGLPSSMTPEVIQIAKRPVGKVEINDLKKDGIEIADYRETKAGTTNKASLNPVSITGKPGSKEKQSIESF